MWYYVAIFVLGLAAGIVIRPWLVREEKQVEDRVKAGVSAVTGGSSGAGDKKVS